MPPTMHWFPIGRRTVLKGAGALFASSALGGLPRAARAAGGRLRGRTYADPTNLDPAFFLAVPDEESNNLLYSKLIQYKPGRKWEWQLDAAAEIEQVDPTHVRFSLRDDMGFSDGFGAMTAEDVKFSLERVVDPAMESPNASDLGPLSHVEVTGERTGVIVHKEPFAPLWSIALPYATGTILSKKAVSALDGKRIGNEPVAISGPYRRVSWSPNQTSVFARNPDWRRERSGYDEIEIYSIDDESAAEIAFEANELDFTRVTLGTVLRLRENPIPGATLEEFPSLFYVWVGMNTDNPALQDPRVRRAIQYAIDVPTIMEASYFGVARPSTGIIAPGLVGNRVASMVPPAGDQEKARALLDEAGVRNLSLTLDILNKTENSTTAQVIQANLAAIGVDLQININDSAAFWVLGNEGEGERWKDLQLFLNRFSMTPDPYYATIWFTQDQVGIWNWERFRSEEFDRLHAEGGIETDPTKRDAIYKRAQDLMEESGAYRFITHEATPVVYRNTVRPGLRPDGLPLWRYFEPA